MHCATCPADRRAACMSEGCCARLAEIRVATVAPGALTEELKRDLLRHLEPGQVVVSEAEGGGDLERQLNRLEVRHGDILVLRTRRKLPAATVTKWQDDLIRMCRDAGVTDVTALVLDDCTELTVERPATRLVQQHREFPQPMQGC